MKPRWRILLVVVPEGERGENHATSEFLDGPPRDPVLLAATLIGLGAELRVVDPGIERLSSRVVAREARWWHADLVLFYAGGSALAQDPLPDDGPLRRLLSASWPDVPLLVLGPLAERYGAELLVRHSRLSGAHLGPVGPWMVGAFDAATAPGLITRQGVHTPAAPSSTTVLPAWHLLPLEAYAGRGPQQVRVALVGDHGDDLEAMLTEARHAVQRAGGRFLMFESRDLGATPELAQELARRMFGEAPGITWACRVRADHMTPALALALAQGACTEVLLTTPSPAHASAQAPMDDPDREPLEAALDAVRVVGMSAVAEHVVGRPGHSVASLDGWQGWLAVRGLPVRAHVRLLHAGDRGVGEPGLDAALQRAGCWDNELSSRDVERAVRRLTRGAAARVSA